MSKKKKHEEHENLERWLVSYADFITLLFAFFVVLYAMSSINEGKYKDLSDSMIAAFQTEPRSMKVVQVGDIKRPKESNMLDKNPSAGAPDTPQQQQRDVESQLSLKQMSNEIEAAMSGLMDKELVKLRRDENWLEVEMNTSILYDSGSAVLAPRALPVLREIAYILRKFPNPINVEGFTDGIPIHTDLFRSNWELSAARAASVVHLFMENGVAPKRMAAIGYGEFRPVADNATEVGRNKNRRVVLAILAQDLSIKRELAGPPGVAQSSTVIGNPPIRQ
ncbi:MAG: flagellar motor protein MotD [Gammaproteobacteria bacterium]|nr:flagellar motor protein MotD [Gammaproteobacteria bacterium]